MELFPVLFGLLQLIVVGLLAWVVLKATGRAVGADRDPAAITRRVFVLALLYAVLLVVAWGVIGLSAEVAADERGSNAALAGALAFLTVGCPSAAVLLRVVDRRLRRDAEEATSIVWSVYLLLVLLTGLTGAMIAGHAALRAAFGVGGDARLEVEPVVAGAVWLSLWAGHWFHFRHRYGVTGDDIHLAVGSVVGLVTLAVGAVGVLTSGGEAVYSSLFGDPAVVPAAAPVDRFDAGPSWAAPLAAVIVGAVAWAWYWWLHYRRCDRSELWYVTVVPIGTLGGFVAAVTGSALAVNAIGVWFLGDPGSTDGLGHFDDLPRFGAVMLVGLAVWLVHRRVLGPDTRRSDAVRAHDYLLALAGVVTFTVGVVLLLVAGFSHGPAGVANTVVAGSTMVLLGGLVWWVLWRRIGRVVAADRRVELGSPLRRIHLFTVFGVGGAAVLIGLLAVLSGVFEDALDGDLSRVTVHDNRVGLAVILGVVGVAWFHVRVHLADRASLTPPPPDAAEPVSAAPDRRRLSGSGI